MTALNIVDLPVRAEIPRDGNDKPLVIPKGGGKPRALIRTTTFIDCIEDKSHLSDWGKRSVLAGAVLAPEVVEAARGLDIKDDKAKLNALAERLVQAAGSNDKREKGTALHLMSEWIEAGIALPESASAADLADMAAYVMAMVDFETKEVETFIVCDELGVGGTFDRTLGYSGDGPPHLEIVFQDELLIGDLKTGTTEYGQSKIAAQLAIYSRGERYDFTRFPVPELPEKLKTGDPVKDWKKRLDRWKKVEVSPEEAALAYSPIGAVNQDWGVIINIPSGSGEATLLWADLDLGWDMALLAQTIRKARGRRNALRPFVRSAAAQGVVPVTPEC